MRAHESFYGSRFLNLMKEKSTRSGRINGIAMALLLLLLMTALLVLVTSIAYAQGEVYWHIDPNVETCSMVINPALTQDEWNKFTEQMGAILSFKSLASAETLGKMNFYIGIDDSYTPIDQHDPAWINTFTHPDEDCPLGDDISYPTIRIRMGVTDDIDVGAYWTTAPHSNYGGVGGELKYTFLHESETHPAAAVRASASILTGVPDFDMDVYSLEVMTSKKIAMITPYVGFRESLSVGDVTTSKVNLHKESVFIPQGYVGATYSIWRLNLAAEYNISSVNTFAVGLGFTF
jgi:hypothetical protein